MSDPVTERKRIGLLVPYFNSVVEPEMAALQPSGVSNQTARFTLDENVQRDLTDTAQRLLACHPDALIIGLATESFPGGLDLLAAGAAELGAATGLPVLTASHAVHAGLEVLGTRRVGIVTPFDAAANENVRAAFEASGFSVIAIEGLACEAFDKIALTPSSRTRAAFERVDLPQVEALVQVGTGLPVLDLIDPIEHERGKPVVACNAAAYWQALRALGVEARIRGAGRLLSEF